MPTSAVIHIQNTAPGPPRKMAVATPAILPVPMVAESDVISALKGVISPASSAGIRPFHNRENPNGIFMIDKNRRPTVRKRPAPRISTSMGTPHTMPFTAPTYSVIASMSRSFHQMRYSCIPERNWERNRWMGNAPGRTALPGRGHISRHATNCHDSFKPYPRKTEATTISSRQFLNITY